MKKLLIASLILCLFSVNTYAYGERGHRLVGAIADRRVARNQALANKIRQLLGGMTLQRVSTLPDEIKGWECGDNPPGANRVTRELRAFVNANCSAPSHNQFHFTNIPVFGDEDYDDGEVGRNEFDIVHMIPFSYPCSQRRRAGDEQPQDHEVSSSDPPHALFRRHSSTAPRRRRVFRRRWHCVWSNHG